MPGQAAGDAHQHEAGEQDRQQTAAPEREAAVEGVLESRRGRLRQGRLAGAHDPFAA